MSTLPAKICAWSTQTSNKRVHECEIEVGYKNIRFTKKTVLFFSEFSKILKIFMILEINFQYFGKFRKKRTGFLRNLENPFQVV